MGLLVTCLLLAMLSISATAAPANVTINTYNGLIGKVEIGEQPRGRGTFGIFLSCTVTFLFCVWTSVHPNIIAGASRWDRLGYKSCLMALSILLPEGLALCAFGQWWEARKLLGKWRLKMGFKDRTWCKKLMFWESAEDDGFGLDGAFFVVMGGFVFDPPPPSESLPAATATTAATVVDDVTPKPLTTTLTSEGFLKYLEEGYIHGKTFKRESIADKGKSSIVAKSIAGIQALWFMVQFASRLVVHLPVTLLEIHVAIQVLFTAFLFVFWWSKPLDVNVPIRIRLEKIEHPIPDPGAPTLREISTSGPEQEGTKTNDEIKTETPDKFFITRPTPSGVIGIAAKASHDLFKYVTEGTIESENHSSKALIAFEAGMVLLGGSLHVAAWNSKFPTAIECFLWRASSIGICVLPVCLAILTIMSAYHLDLAKILWKLQLERYTFFTFFKYLYGEARQSLHQCATKFGVTTLFWPMVTLFGSFVAIAFYIFALLFITVESYICLRAPPDGAFMTPVWVGYWPHV